MTPLEVHDLHFRYPGGDPVLQGLSFAVPAGDRLAILGPNGAGKSTLLLHLNGLLLPERGNVSVDGLQLRDDTLRAVRRQVGMVFQDPDDQLFLPSLLDDVAFGPLNDGADPAEAERAARQTLDDLGLPHADRAAHHLSGGERRLAALATTLVMRPGILVLDEPTAGLDARARRRVVDLLQARDETLILATHDLDVARALCRHAIILADGRIAARGTLPALLDDDELLRTHGLVDPLALADGRGSP